MFRSAGRTRPRPWSMSAISTRCWSLTGFWKAPAEAGSRNRPGPSFDRRVGAVAPFRRRPRVTPDVGVAEVFQDKIGMGGAVVGLAVDDDLLVGRHADRREHISQLRRGPQAQAVGPVHGVHPVEIHRPRYVAAARGAHDLPAVLTPTPGVRQHPPG